MISGAEIYSLVKGGLKVANRSDDELRALLAHLGSKARLGGKARRIGGEAMAEAVIRFMKTEEVTDA